MDFDVILPRNCAWTDCLYRGELDCHSVPVSVSECLRFISQMYS